MADSDKAERRWELLSRADTALSLSSYFPWKTTGLLAVGLVPTVLAVVAKLPWWAISLVALGGVALSLLILLFALYVMRFIAERRFAQAKPVVSSGPTDNQIALWFTHQAEDAIRIIRDKQGSEVDNLHGLLQMYKEAGRWFGRTEYVAEQLRDRYPAEVSEFLVHGGKLSYPVSVNDDVKTARNHLQALITLKVERLRKLAQAIAR